MSTTAVTRDQFDQALQALLAAEATRDQVVLAALNDLKAKVAAGAVVTPEDFTNELATVSALYENAAAITQTATVDDPGPTTVPVEPIATPATPAPVVDPTPVATDPTPATPVDPTTAAPPTTSADVQSGSASTAGTTGS